jgi:hypothetical protein
MDADGLTPDGIIEVGAHPETVDAGQLGKHEQIDRRSGELGFEPTPHRRRGIGTIREFTGRHSKAHGCLHR